MLNVARRAKAAKNLTDRSSDSAALVGSLPEFCARTMQARPSACQEQWLLTPALFEPFGAGQHLALRLQQGWESFVAHVQLTDLIVCSTSGPPPGF